MVPRGTSNACPGKNSTPTAATPASLATPKPAEPEEAVGVKKSSQTPVALVSGQNHEEGGSAAPKEGCAANKTGEKTTEVAAAEATIERTAATAWTEAAAKAASSTGAAETVGGAAGTTDPATTVAA